ENTVLKAEKTVVNTRTNRDKTLQQLNEVKTRITSLKENMAIRKLKLVKLESSLMIRLNEAGFENENIFISCRLSSEERHGLTRKAKELDNKQSHITARKTDRESKLSQETTKKLTKTPLEELKQQQTDAQETLKTHREETGAIKQKIADNITAKTRYQKKQVLIDLQEKEFSRWNRLHSLIGSADGKKFRNFAQGLTFELMVSHANKQLEKMTDRYLLIRDNEQPLELNVIDNYQAGEIRSTKNLSGGESFIVSLSLALGLSGMASGKTRVDSLFLDEGFGTLDEDALETALETLAGLHQDGKLIGIISHVSALKERISTQITVQPISGGKSTISGPGCALKKQ
ncbi:chromosome segregation protein SMC, partial [bacterium]|nr:chromosome segregation protein SMC [bacterium]